MLQNSRNAATEIRAAVRVDSQNATRRRGRSLVSASRYITARKIRVWPSVANHIAFGQTVAVIERVFGRKLWIVAVERYIIVRMVQAQIMPKLVVKRRAK